MKSRVFMFTIIALLSGLIISNFAVSEALTNFKVATVDIQKVVSNSREVKALKAENKKQIEELVAFVNTAKTDLTKETNVEKRKKLEEKYNKQLNDKKAALDKAYAKKLAEIDKNITSIIQKEAQAKGYNLVLAKGIVLFGGEDITDIIMQSVK